MEQNKFIIKCWSMRHADYILHIIREKTWNWEGRPRIFRKDRTIYFNNTMIFLAVTDKDLKGRHDWVIISQESLFYAIDRFNERLLVKNGNLFNFDLEVDDYE